VEADLADALEAGEIRGASLDVFGTELLPSDSTLLDRDDVVMTPNNAGSTPLYWLRSAAIVVRNIPRFEADELDAFEIRVV
jgi:glyoxylate/hydroxypyruvate reductase A